ncbi:unnamed protein product [Caenorhabditis auriculariae]|uniref:Rhodanese domain-containing protein n=1 Tax=Caenorhabditis auriculariae TaxID=2777116 RepID=A0A8S1HIZ4_9PELO|nr:unnamed protein product [Caenorhabditis auriculariae]
MSRSAVRLFQEKPSPEQVPRRKTRPRSAATSPSAVRTPSVIYVLPAADRPYNESPTYRNISPRTLADQLRRNSFRELFVLIDCRYPYEYAGGHIRFIDPELNPSDMSALSSLYPGEGKESAEKSDFIE